MKYKKRRLIISVLLTYLLIIFLFPISSNATGVIGLMDGMNAISQSGFDNLINIVIGLIQIAGTGIAIIGVTIQGIKYIMASPSQKADVKKTAVPFVIGCILLFAAANVVKIIGTAAQSI